VAPEVSVCIPAYRAAEFLPSTLRSVLASDHLDFEVVVIDNASPDRTDRAVRPFVDDPRVRFIACTDYLDLADNWRRAMGYCQGRFIKLVCADDLIHHTALRKQAAILDRDPEVSLVASRRHLIDGSGYILSPASGIRGLVGRHTASEVAQQVVRCGINPIGEPGGTMFRRTDYEAVGGWDPNGVFNMDIDLFLRLLSRGDLVGIKETLAAFRIWPQSMSGHHSDEQCQENLRFLRRVRDQYGVKVDDRWLVRAANGAWKAWELRRRYWQHRPRLWSRPLAT
jgi:glycosyltransferase involved in cell wall biosynthesis